MPPDVRVSESTVGDKGIDMDDQCLARQASADSRAVARRILVFQAETRPWRCELREAAGVVVAQIRANEAIGDHGRAEVWANALSVLIVRDELARRAALR